MSDIETQQFLDLSMAHLDFLYGKVNILTPSARIAECLVQRTLQAAYNEFAYFNKESDFRKWLEENLKKTVANISCHE
jgi:DNA-directed RNA polymerase specialized sigma24 family protein